MTRKTTLSTIFALAALLPAATTAQSIDWKVFAEPFVSIAHAQSIDWKKVDAALGKTATVSGEVHRYGLPRSDLHVTLDGVADQAGARARRLGRLRADAWPGDGDGRPRSARDRDHSGHDQTARQRSRDHRHPQPHPARLRRRPSTCTSAATAIRRRWPPRSARRCRRTARRRSIRRRPPPPRPRRSISTPRSSTRSWRQGHTPTAASISSACRAAIRATEGGMAVTPGAWRRQRHQLPADRRRQGGHHRRFRGDRRRGQSADQGAARQRHRSHRDPQSHARRAAALFFMHFWANDDAMKLAQGVRAALDKTAVAQR